MASIKMATIDWRLVIVVAFLWKENTENPGVGNVTDTVATIYEPVYFLVRSSKRRTRSPTGHPPVACPGLL